MLMRKLGRALRRDKRALVCAVFLLIIVLLALAAPLLPLNPRTQNLRGVLQTPSFEPVGDTVHLLGTDQLGRDLLARLLYGARVSLAIGAVSVLIAAFVGSTLGILAGYFGGVFDAVVTGLTETVLALPFVVFAIAVIAAVGSSLPVLILTLGLTGWVSVAKLTRARVFELREEEFVQAAKALGGSHGRAMARHILPNTVPLIIVDATLQLGAMILAEAGLSFLGLGVQPPTPTLGNILNEGQVYVSVAWWIPTFPGLLLLFIVLSINFLGDFLRDVLDPEL